MPKGRDVVIAQMLQGAIVSFHTEHEFGIFVFPEEGVEAIGIEGGDGEALFLDAKAFEECEVVVVVGNDHRELADGDREHFFARFFSKDTAHGEGITKEGELVFHKGSLPGQADQKEHRNGNKEGKESPGTCLLSG